MLLVNNNDENCIYYTQDENSLNFIPGMPGFLSSKKKENKNRNAVVKYDLENKDEDYKPEVVGYFIGELDAIARQPKSRYMLGFMFDANRC